MFMAGQVCRSRGLAARGGEGYSMGIMTAIALPDGTLDLAHRLADAAGGVIRPYFRTLVSVDDKADESPVTVADREAEMAMRTLLLAERPDDGLVGEEHGTVNPGADWVWVLDPIDGTKSFITGMPTFGTLIALLYKGLPVLGIIDQPISGERWVGVSGQRSTLNGREISVRDCAGLGQAVAFTTDPALFTGDDAAAWARLNGAVKMRRYSADCYAYGLLATGFVDVVCEAGMKLYDFAAVVPVIQGAGGIITDWQGGPLGQMSDGHILAAGDARTHAEAMQRLKG